MRDEPSRSDDGTIMVTWKTVPVVIVFVVVLIVVCGGTPRQQHIAIWSVVGTCGVVWLYFLVRFFRRGLLRSHPASRIAHLIAEGHIEEAHATAMDCLREHPDDPVVQLNSVAALYGVGDKAEAGRLFSNIHRAALPRFLRRAYDDWQRQLREANQL